MACLVPGIRRWIMKIKNDQLNILEKGRKKNQRSVKRDTRKKEKKERETYIYIKIKEKETEREKSSRWLVSKLLKYKHFYFCR